MQMKTGNWRMVETSDEQPNWYRELCPHETGHRTAKTAFFCFNVHEGNHRIYLTVGDRVQYKASLPHKDAVGLCVITNLEMVTVTGGILGKGLCVTFLPLSGELKSKSGDVTWRFEFGKVEFRPLGSIKEWKRPRIKGGENDS